MPGATTDGHLEAGDPDVDFLPVRDRVEQEQHACGEHDLRASRERVQPLHSLSFRVGNKALFSAHTLSRLPGRSKILGSES
jgi:hypothetical protein